MRCNGFTKYNKRCKLKATKNGYCHCHSKIYNKEKNNENICLFCYEKIEKEDKISCGHNIHKKCLQKSCNSIQDINSENGYPPLKTCNCPICNKIISEIKPKKPLPVETLSISQIESIVNIYNENFDEENDELDTLLYITLMLLPPNYDSNNYNIV